MDENPFKSPEAEDAKRASRPLKENLFTIVLTGFIYGCLVASFITLLVRPTLDWSIPATIFVTVVFLYTVIVLRRRHG